MTFIDYLLDALETWDHAETAIAETVKNHACVLAGIPWDQLSDRTEPSD